MKKKITLIIIIFLAIYLCVTTLLGKGLFSVADNLFTRDQVKTIKKYVFPYKTITEKDRTIMALKKEGKEINSYLFEAELNFKKSLNDIQIEKVEDVQLSNNKVMNKFTIATGFYSSMWSYPGGYIDFHENNLFILSSRGILGYGQNLYNKNFKQIENNLNDFIGLKQFNKNKSLSFRDLFIHEDKIFISFLEEVKDNCFNTSFVQGTVDYKFIKFEKIFFDKDNNCIHSKNNIDKEFEPMQSGGRIVNFDREHILLSVGEYRNRYLAQQKDNINGKIIKVNINKSIYEIISMGHRNPQGLYYDKENNIILETEHGPMGGDEINLIEIDKINQEDHPNYGWAIVSEGEHYRGKVKDNIEKYKKYPLYKSHNKYGFIEPLKSFAPSIGISEITKISKNKYVVSSMKDQSLYFFELDSSKKISNLERIEVFERVRDIKFKNNKLYLFLEETASIGMIDFTY
jgi:hypothetical protein